MHHYQASSLQLNCTFPPSSTPFGGFTDEDLISNAGLKSLRKADIKMTNVHIFHRYSPVPRLFSTKKKSWESYWYNSTFKAERA